MSNSKMSQIIKSVLEVTDSVLGKPATRGQVIQVIELIESFDIPAKPQAKVLATTQTMIKSKTKTSAKKKPRRTYSKPKVVVNWSELKWWIDEMLDGKTHIVTHSELSVILPIHSMNLQAIETKLRKEARVRGYKKVTILFKKAKNATFNTMFIHAIK